MTVTQGVTHLGSTGESRAAAVYVPDLVVQKLSIETDFVVAQYKLGTPPEQWMNEPLKEEARTLLMGLPVEKESYQVHDTLFLTMRQEKRVLAPGALHDFFAITRSDGVAAFIQKYGLFKHPGRWEPEIRVSIEDFMRERRHMHSLLRIWVAIQEGDSEEALAIASREGLNFGTDACFALSVYLSTRLLSRSFLTLVAVSGKLEPMHYCRDVLTGLYALLLQAVIDKRPWSVCLNCPNAFSAGRAGKKFCSEGCQQAYKQRRYRENLKPNSRKSRMRRKR